ncbi:MAG TPA: FtsX-like permease family protein, partial [Ktedonobacteraceae bacterium]|nr:FtsX-like permease family protein [Ktedonobacteraceae bacterium]
MNRSSGQSLSSTILNRLTSVVSLALWRWRQHWFLLLLTGLGMLAAIMLACILPLLTLVLQTTELHDTLTASPSAAELTLHTETIGLSSQTLNVINRFGGFLFQNDLNSYLQGQPRLEIQTPEFSIIAPEEAQLRTPLRLYGNPINAATSHVIVKQGRLPSPTSQNIEIALTPDTASALHVKVGSVITVVSNFSTVPVRGTAATAFQETFCSIVPGKGTTSVTSEDTYCQRFKLDVVGIFDVKTNDYFWHGENFQPQSHDTRMHYAALASNDALLSVLDAAAANHNADSVYFLEGYYSSLSWYYYLDPSLVSLNNLDDLIKQLSAGQETVNQANGFALRYQLPLVNGFDLRGSVLSNYAVPGSLENFRSRIAIARIPIFILTLQIICLLLFFIGIMIELLIERQSNAIALLRSRGASIGQIFGSHITQTLMLCILALIAGPFLAYIGAIFIAQLVLPSTNQDAIKVLTTDPVTTLWNVRWYALIIAGAIVVVLLAALYRASRIYVPAQRRESGQAAAHPLWQRLNLDLVATIVALTGYGIAVYLADIGGLLDAHTQALVSAPLGLVAPVFLLLAAVLLFLRVTPPLLRLLSRLLARSRGAVPMLAITQLSRSPRQSVRMIMLLALATAFAMFTLIFAASQAQRATSLAAYSAGADFSGSIPSTAPGYPINIETQRYRNIQGVLAASVGEVAGENVGNVDNLFPLEVKAIDPGTFAQATIWNSQNSAQPLNTLLAQLAAQRKSAIQQHIIPAIVDAYTWNKLGLHVGESFFVHQNGTLTNNVRYIAIAEVQSIPTLTNLDIVANQQFGNMIVDYQTFSAIEKRLYGFEPPANYVWLHTSDDPAAVAHVRDTLQSSNLYLDNLQDRRALVSTLQADPLYLNLIIVLMLGVGAALLLGLIGDLQASWLSVRSRLNQFVALRALGATFRQITGIMAYEQGLIYLVALCLGIVFGMLLAVTVVPTLLLSTPPDISGGTNSVIIDIVQQLLPAQTVFPWSLGIVFAALLILCITAVLIMAWVALRPSMSSTLRLDEDQPPLAVLREEVGRRLATPVRAPSHRAGLSFMILAFGQIRRTWLLLVTTGIGIIAAIVMVCAIPLFSQVMTTAGLQTT